MSINDFKTTPPHATPECIAGLNKLLVNSYALLLKTQSHHWNVIGINFLELHKLFDDHYNDIFTAIDSIAERIRKFNSKVSVSISNFAASTAIKEPNKDASPEEMVKDLHDDHIYMASLIEEVIKTVSENDEATKSLLGDRLEVHQKNAWMLGAMIRPSGQI